MVRALCIQSSRANDSLRALFRQAGINTILFLNPLCNLSETAESLSDVQNGVSIHFIAHEIIISRILTSAAFCLPQKTQRFTSQTAWLHLFCGGAKAG